MQWYYLSDSHERIAVSEAQFTSLAAGGVLRPATPVWRKGMADWAACGEVKPEVFAAGVSRDSDERHPITDNAAVRGTVIGLARTLAGYNVWLRIFGVLMLIFAVAEMALLGWETWLLIQHGTKVLNSIFANFAEFGWILWVALLLQCLFIAISA